jgi:hypothetical protein
MFFADFVGKKHHTDRERAAPQAYFCGVQTQRHYII